MFCTSELARYVGATSLSRIRKILNCFWIALPRAGQLGSILNTHSMFEAWRIEYRSLTRAVWKVSSHFEYIENRSCGLDVTWQPVRRYLTLHP